VQDTLVSRDTVIKKDKSPVTGMSRRRGGDIARSRWALTAVADLSAQALISLHLLAHYPQDKIIGEEDTSELRANAPLREKVVDLVNGGFKREEGWGKDKSFTEDE
jgi:3'(2'), 5'-bisphosphate nucleotidase